MAIRVGTAPDSWGVWFPVDEHQVPWRRFLDEVVQGGYDTIELGPFGYLPTDPDVVADELRRRALQLAGGTFQADLDAVDSWSVIKPEFARICDVLTRLGSRFLVVLDQGYTDTNGAIVGPRQLDESGWGHLRDTVHRLGEYAAGREITAVFHPHADTTVQYEPDIEHFLELTDPALVQLCLDVGHHAYAGGEPVAFFQRHHARVKYLHLKDVDRSVCERARSSGMGFEQAVAAGAFVDLGQGCVDLPGLAAAARAVDFSGWGIVEQDMYPAPFDKPLPVARRNREYLRSNGIG